MAYLLLLIHGVEHDNGAALVFVHHAPEVDHRVRQGHLRDDVRVTLLEPL